MVKYMICIHKKQVRFLLFPFVKIKSSVYFSKVNLKSKMNYIFVNKNKRNKDKLICQTFSNNYFDFLVITNIFKCKNIKLETDLLYLIRLNYKLMLLNKYNYKSYHKDISFLSGRTKAIITKYGLARTDFKKLMTYHHIPGICKSSW